MAMHSIEEQLASLQAQLMVQDMVLRALVRTHRNPEAVRNAWREIRADAIAASYAIPPDGPRRHLLDCIQARAEQWDGELQHLTMARKSADPA